MTEHPKQPNQSGQPRANQKIRAVFFDCDGTIVNSEDIFLAVARKVFKKYNVEISDQFVAEESFKNNTSQFELLRRAGFNEAIVDEARRARDAFYLEGLKRGVKFLPGMEAVLKFLRGKVKMGIVSNAHKEHLNASINKCGLQNYFDFFVEHEDVTNYKPAPDCYLLALKKAGVAAENAIVVEDTIRGIIAGKNAGIKSFLVPSDMTPQSDYHYADKVFKNGNELLEFFKKHI